MGQIYSLTSDEAEEIMAAAIQTLKTQFKVASVVIVNRDGTEIAKSVMDGVRLFTTNVACMKAKQAAWIGKPTSVTRDQLSEGEITPAILGIAIERIVPWAGGVPIYDEEGHLLGGIGVSNLTQEDDEAVAGNAIGKVGFKEHA
ncbi:MAG: GlcG/HbpS family heme-binding protein [Candidatus Moraniibacteriota bacterium]|jgi:glc operon protein GlcG